MKRQDLTKTQISKIDKHLSELAKQRFKIVSVNQTKEEKETLKQLEINCAKECYKVSKEYAEHTWPEIKFYE